jgi:hypothetical protein
VRLTGTALSRPMFIASSSKVVSLCLGKHRLHCKKKCCQARYDIAHIVQSSCMYGNGLLAGALHLWLIESVDT